MHLNCTKRRSVCCMHLWNKLFRDGIIHTYFEVMVYSCNMMHQRLLYFINTTACLTWIIFLHMKSRLLISLHNKFQFVNCCFNISVSNLKVHDKSNSIFCHRTNLDNGCVSSKLGRFLFCNLLATVILQCKILFIIIILIILAISKCGM